MDPENENPEAGNQAEDKGAGTQPAPDDKDGDKGKANPEDELPQWAKDELSRTRREAARYRTERNGLKEQFKDAKTPDEFQAVLAEYEEKVQQAELKALRESVARKHKLPDALANRLQGTSEEELTEDAKALAQFAPSSRKSGDAADLKGGLDPNNEPENFDVNAAAMRIMSRR